MHALLEIRYVIRAYKIGDVAQWRQLIQRGYDRVEVFHAEWETDGVEAQQLPAVYYAREIICGCVGGVPKTINLKLNVCFFREKRIVPASIVLCLAEALRYVFGGGSWLVVWTRQLVFVFRRPTRTLTMVALLLNPNQLAPMRARGAPFSSRMTSLKVERATLPLRPERATTRKKFIAPIDLAL